MWCEAFLTIQLVPPLTEGVPADEFGERIIIVVVKSRHRSASRVVYFNIIIFPGNLLELSCQGKDVTSWRYSSWWCLFPMCCVDTRTIFHWFWCFDFGCNHGEPFRIRCVFSINREYLSSFKLYFRTTFASFCFSNSSSPNCFLYLLSFFLLTFFKLHSHVKLNSWC